MYGRRASSRSRNTCKESLDRLIDGLVLDAPNPPAPGFIQQELLNAQNHGQVIRRYHPRPMGWPDDSRGNRRRRRPQQHGVLAGHGMQVLR
jgi:hypothetical protein